MDLVDALAHVEAGRAGEHIERFIQKAIFQMLQATTNNEHSQEVDDAFVTAIALLRMEGLPDARQFMGKGRRPRGDAFKAGDLFNKCPGLSAAMEQYLSGKTDKNSLLQQFGDAIEDEFGKTPDTKTVNRVMNDYMSRYALAHRQVGVFVEIAGGDVTAGRNIFRRFIGHEDEEK